MLQRPEFLPLEEAAPQPQGPEPEGFDLHEAINFAWRQWKFIAGVAALAILLGAIHLARQTPLYTATAELLLEPNSATPLAQNNGQGDQQALDFGMVQSQVDIIKSTSLLRRVVAKEKLANGSNSADANSGGLLASIKRFFGASAPRSAAQKPNAGAAADAGFDSIPPAVAAAVGGLQAGLKVRLSGQSYVLNISYTSPDPKKAARIANAIADAYVVDKLEARYEAAKRASAWLNDHLVQLRKQLHESEEAVAQFRAANNLIQAGPGATLTQAQLAQLNGKLVAARAETAEKKASLDQLRQAQASGGNISSLPEVMSDATIADLRKQENDVSRQLADLRTHYSDRYPKVVNQRAQLSDIRRAIRKEISRLTSNVKDQYQLALARQQAIEQTLRQVSGENNLDNAKAITLRQLERTAAVDKTLFDDFLQRAKVTQAQSTFQARDARVISPAEPPSFPSSPKKKRTMIVSALLGLMAGVGGAYLLEMLNAGFTTPRQVEELLEMPVLGSISKMDPLDLTIDGVAVEIPKIPFIKPLSRFSESARTLRSAIQMSDVDHPPKIVQVTSANPSEGKTTVALTLAASAAQAGQRVLVMDCDLRHPSASRHFSTEKALGLVDYLVGGADLSNIVAFNDELRLWVAPAGGKTQNPPDLLGSAKLKSLVEILRQKFDLVVIDSPPTGPVVDPLIVAQFVDKVIFVVRWAATPREIVADAIKRLTGHKKVAGVVFNYVVEAKAQKYGKGAAAYYYGGRYYKKYYGE